MKSKLVSLFAALLAGIVISCSSVPGGSGSGPISAKNLDMVKNAVFEVVVEKPASDPTVYEKDLDWDKVPFAVRNDKYYSIGTAFAISKTELITAFHVINLGYESLTNSKYFIRDSDQNVYEVDQVSGGSNEKDYLIFTVKGKTFNQYFQFERNYKTGDPVFSVGNALGEGIVVRNGLVLGTVPEEDSGRWNLLKSSADGNPGNSGGPLVNSAGKVVALVTALRDNILYSVPSDVILGDSRSALSYRVKPQFGHLILANKLNYVIETNPALPDTYTGVRKKIRDVYEKEYDTAMSALFKEAPEYLTGPNNAYLLNSVLSTSFPEISFVDPNDDNWKLSSFEKKGYPLDDNGRLTASSVAGINFYKIKRPASVPLEQIDTNPKYIMDLILRTIRTERTLWGNDKYRILSFGEPSSTGLYRDAMGRTWITAYWVIGFVDRVQIMYILPQPNGPAIIATMQDSENLFDYEWDLRKSCDHVFAAYDGTFLEWSDFITLKKYIPDFLGTLRFEWKSSEQSFSLNSGPLSVSAGKQVFDWANDSQLFLAPSWYKQNNKLEFGIRKLTLNRDPRGKEFIIFFKNIKPDPKLGTNAMENWNDLAVEKFPFDGKPVIAAKDNTGSVGAVIKARQPDPDIIYSLYLSMENPQSEDNLARRFDALKQGVDIQR
ncbi:MAG: serine protease [Treponema sp.]|nr:serine protease [Treponema sp.]